MAERKDNEPAVAVLKGVGDYYSAKVSTHGASPAGVDWGSADRQQRRFAVLASALPRTGELSLLDLGCGYGAFWDYLQQSGRACRYLGTDISEEMIQRARELHPELGKGAFRIGTIPDEMFDFVVASGIFNVMAGASSAAWLAHVRETIGSAYAHCRFGCAFNFLTSYSDEDKRKPGLYYADPGEIVRYCLAELSLEVDLIHHYGIWDFTVQIFRKRPAL